MPWSSTHDYDHCLCSHPLPLLTPCLCSTLPLLSPCLHSHPLPLLTACLCSTMPLLSRSHPASAPRCLCSHPASAHTFAFPHSLPLLTPASALILPLPTPCLYSTLRSQGYMAHLRAATQACPSYLLLCSVHPVCSPLCYLCLLLRVLAAYPPA
jgi:hypothetical protein